MEYDRPLECCGIAELSYIRGSTPRNCVRYVASCMLEEQDEIHDNDYSDFSDGEFQAPFIVFSDIGDCATGKALARYIKSEKLGSCINTVSRVNPRSGNALRMWVWTIKKRELKKWYEKQ